MISFKKKYFLIIESIKDISLRNIKKNNKFIIIYRYQNEPEEIENLVSFRKKCRLSSTKFFVANNISLAVKLNADGIYLSSKNKEFKSLNLKKDNFSIIGSAHNIKEINIKKKQGCDYVLLSRLFKVSYKPNLNYLGINKFNKYVFCFDKKIVPLGGINHSNLNNIKNLRSEAIAIMTEIKKKPAIISRLF
ncbi:MAG: thiamine phosphate synthase [Pseudomonadota bacterium]|nr:thiamine phosphate synthase [Pseudomonadota bacterium]